MDSWIKYPARGGELRDVMNQLHSAQKSGLLLSSLIEASEH